MTDKLKDEMLEKVTGGVGGENEATCPVCGKPMKFTQNPYGSDSWKCTCGETQFMSDAEYIMFLEAAEAAGQTQGLVYPVWWNQVPHPYVPKV